MSAGGESSAAPSVERFFDTQAPYWREVYEQEGLEGLIYRERMQAALEWIDELGPPAGASVLEVGSGAGLMTAALAQRGFEVTSTDSSPEMVAQTASEAERQGVRVRALSCDAHQLPFETAQFELVVALGVLPWLRDPAGATIEMVRVMRAGRLIVLTADNRLRLNVLVGQNPVLEPLKALYRAQAGWRGRSPGIKSRLHTPRAADRLLVTAGATPIRRRTIGFGPLALHGRPLLGEEAGLRLHRRLQALSDRDVPVIRRAGWHYLVAARKEVD